MEPLCVECGRHIGIPFDGREAMIGHHDDVGRVAEPLLVERGKDLGQILIRVLIAASEVAEPGPVSCCE